MNAVKATDRKTAADHLPSTACAEGVAFAKTFKTIAEAWSACNRGDWLIWYARRKMDVTKEQWVRIAVACAEHALPIYEKRYPGDNRPRAAVEAAREFLKSPTEENRRAADAAAAADASAADASAAAAAAA
ncbi:MAG: hypothetical protein HZA88_16510, partial [Verrucomicrobia bacterium]|nr:hypothetical protein [Verrucomicrobiota bacterium]